MRGCISCVRPRFADLPAPPVRLAVEWLVLVGGFVAQVMIVVDQTGADVPQCRYSVVPLPTPEADNFFDAAQQLVIGQSEVTLVKRVKLGPGRELNTDPDLPQAPLRVFVSVEDQRPDPSPAGCDPAPPV